MNLSLTSFQLSEPIPAPYCQIHQSHSHHSHCFELIAERKTIARYGEKGVTSSPTRESKREQQNSFSNQKLHEQLQECERKHSAFGKLYVSCSGQRGIRKSNRIAHGHSTCLNRFWTYLTPSFSRPLKSCIHYFYPTKVSFCF